MYDIYAGELLRGYIVVRMPFVYIQAEMKRCSLKFALSDLSDESYLIINRSPSAHYRLPCNLDLLERWILLYTLQVFFPTPTKVKGGMAGTGA